jgi:hypothetical protein
MVCCGSSASRMSVLHMLTNAQAGWSLHSLPASWPASLTDMLACNLEKSDNCGWPCRASGALLHVHRLRTGRLRKRAETHAALIVGALATVSDVHTQQPQRGLVTAVHYRPDMIFKSAQARHSAVPQGDLSRRACLDHAFCLACVLTSNVQRMCSNTSLAGAVLWSADSNCMLDER